MIGHPNDDDGRVGDYVFLKPIYKADVNDVSKLTKHKIFLKNNNNKRVFDAEYIVLKISMQIAREMKANENRVVEKSATFLY